MSSNKVVRLPLEAIEPFMLPTPPPTPGRAFDPPPARLDWHAIFGNDNPVEVEVGSGLVFHADIIGIQITKPSSPVAAGN